MGAPKIPPPPPPPAPPPPPTETAERVKPARKQAAKKRTRGVSSLVIRRPSVNTGGMSSGANVNS